MSYQVMARKWRPQNFDQLVGQVHISQTLKNAMKEGRLPHALLFTGPRGTGKTSTARILAKALRCPYQKDFEACHKCPECLDIAGGRAVNVLEIDGASNNGVDAIRDLRDTVNYLPSSGEKKIYIIDEVHMLSGSAFNALLKTLEEPPAHVIFILATTEVHKIPQTILSRCQRFDFRRIPTRQISEHLKYICLQENRSASDEALWMIARQGDGSMRDSQSLLDQVINFTAGDLSAEKVSTILGLNHQTLLRELLDALVRRLPQAALRAIHQFHQTGSDPQIFLESILENLRHLIVVKTGSGKSNEWRSAIDLPESEVEWLSALANEVSVEDAHLLFDMTLKGLEDILRSPDPQLVFDVVILRLAQAPQIRSLQSLLKDLAGGNAASKDTGSNTVAYVPAGTTTTNKSAPVDQWVAFVRDVRRKDAFLGAKIEPLQFVKIENKEISVRIPKSMSFLRDQFTSADTKEKLQKLSSQHWNQELSWIFLNESSEVSPGSKGVSVQKINQIEEQRNSATIAEKVADHPKVKSMANKLNGQIKSIQPIGEKT